MTIPEVHSPLLGESLEIAAPKISNFTATLDSISNDIKAIEKWLQECQVRVEVEVVYYTSPFCADDPVDLERSVTGTKTMRALVWAETAEGRTWRIQFREYRAQGALSLTEGEFLEVPELVSSRPLIEMPASVRLKSVEGLSMLVEKISKAIPEREAQLMIDGVVRIARHGDVGFDLMFVPSGTKAETLPARKCFDVKSLESDLSLLGLADSRVREVVALLGKGAEVSVPSTISAKRLAALGILSDSSESSRTGKDRERPRAIAPFEEFWVRLKAELTSAPSPKPGVHVLTIRKWSQHSGEMPGEFTLVYKGGNVVECDTATTDNWRSVGEAEFRKVYEVWLDYRSGRKHRRYIVQELGVQNSAWIIPILYRYEYLMH